MRLRDIGRHDDGDQPRPDLVAVLEHYGVSMTRTGMVACPLHEDRTPSCSVDENKGLWKCHSCGQGGDSYTLIMQKESTSFVGARTLAASLGLPADDAGGGDEHLSGSSYGGRRPVPGRSRDRRGGGGYVPAWRRH
ncbi:CHC2 zinc finger domain-containing protein [Streptomyces sp. TBY4]|uniref:CHC2 zinc finger domain-containing protein n=1 Tax=Streptomyces sp. TBY4 TaxID=2962030 RepID=UPI0027E594B4|nr:CHC2 zinc finger domain-containing protein [Streptomyces sp. TBY4]